MSITQESVEDFRKRARAWLSENMPLAKDATPFDPNSSAHVRFDRMRELQRKLWDGGFAGIAWPAEYGGLGLTPEHQKAFNEEAVDYELPVSLNVPTFGILAATLLDFGTHEQKSRHIPAILKGEELWVQFLSEPSGGSDLAGVLTKAERDGDTFIMNGSKIWSSFAQISDYAMVLTRTNWDVPKHRGLTMFILKIHQPKVEIEPIKMTYGMAEFCQEFFNDVVLSVDDVVGEIDGGWTVATALLNHERASIGGASRYTSGPALTSGSTDDEHQLLRLAQSLGTDDDPIIRQKIGEFRAEELTHDLLSARLTKSMRKGTFSPSGGAILKLDHALIVASRARAAIEIAGSASAVATPGFETARALGNTSLTRQGIALGGGTNEIQRNIISERVLGMPREWAADADLPYREVRRGPGSKGPNQ